MTAGIGWTRALLEGWAQHWADAGFGEWRGTEGTYADGEDVCSIMPGPLVATTTTAIALSSPYGPTHLPGRIDVVPGQALMILGRDLNATTDLVDALVASLHERGPLQLGLLHLTKVLHQSTAYLGTDGDGRRRYSLNFRFRGGDASRQTGLQPPTA